MKEVVWLLVIILVPYAYAWEQYQNDNLNTGRTDGIGNFNNFKGNITISEGFDFQPLVSDLDGDGSNEIIIFSDDTLMVLDKRLNEIDSSAVGIVLGQPIVFDTDGDSLKEVIFASNISFDDCFLVYGFNGSLIKKINLSIENGAVV